MRNADCGSSGSSSKAQIFNRSLLWEKIEDSSLGLPPPEPLEGGPELHYFLLGEDAFALMCWMVKPYSQRQLVREERIANYRIFRGRRVVENAFRILVSFRVLLGTKEQRPRVATDIVFTCVMLHNMMGTHQGGADRALTPENDVVAQQNEQEVYVPNGNYRNPSREAKHQQELLKDNFNNVGALAGQEERI